MFRVGDKIVHPLHGAGVISEIVSRQMDGKMVDYYAMKLEFDEIVLFLPVDTCDQFGVRPVCSREDAEALLSELADVDAGDEKGWNQRYRENMQRIKSGDLYEVARVVKGLHARSVARGLSSGEKKMLSSATQILASELAYALGKPYAEMEELMLARLCP